MRIHSNVIGYTQQIRNALAAEKAAGRIASHVTFKTLAPHRSHSREFAYEVQLEAAQRDNGRRAGNSGSYGAMRPEYDGYAATYDEWGWLLAALYRIDPAILVGMPSSPYYRDREDFNHKTGLTYDPWAWFAYVNEWPTFADSRDPYPYITGRAVGTKRGYLIGRRGAGRLHETQGAEHARWGRRVEERPRTVAEVAEFTHLTPAELATAPAPTHAEEVAR